VKSELEIPSENPERWINKLIQINKRIGGCHTSQKKSDITMIAHALSRLPKEEKYYKNFVAMQRKLGYNKQSILEFKREVYDYWKCNIQGMFEDKEDEQVYMVQNHKMKMLQREKCHEKQEKGSYCYIDFLEEDEMEAAELDAQKRERENLCLLKRC